MDRSEALTGIKEVFKRILGDNLRVEILETSRPTTDLAVDSLDNLEIVIDLEEKFGIEIQDSETTNIKTVGELVDLVLKKKAVSKK